MAVYMYKSTALFYFLKYSSTEAYMYKSTVLFYFLTNILAQQWQCICRSLLDCFTFSQISSTVVHMYKSNALFYFLHIF